MKISVFTKVIQVRNFTKVTVQSMGYYTNIEHIVQRQFTSVLLPG